MGQTKQREKSVPSQAGAWRPHSRRGNRMGRNDAGRLVESRRLHVYDRRGDPASRGSSLSVFVSFVVKTDHEGRNTKEHEGVEGCGRRR
jgi:hypothetical protein